MTTVAWMLRLSFLIVASGCSHPDAIEPDAGGAGPAVGELQPAPAASELQATSHLTRHLYILNEAPSCAGTLSGFFQCALTQTNWNDLALTYTQGETILWGGQKSVKYAPSGCCSGGVCSSDPWGIRSLSCGGVTYQYQMVSPAGHESDGTCKTLSTPSTGANGVGTAAGTCTPTEITNARLNGVNYWTCQGNARYVCDERSNKVVEACPSGCMSAGVGADDQCNGGGGPSCTQTEITHQIGSGSALPSIWTCQGSDRYVCDGHGFKVTQACHNGCQGEGFNHDDQCL